MKQEDSIEKSVLWYSQKRPLYELLSKKVRDLIDEVLHSEKINYASIEFRAKTIESFKRKLEKGITFKPEEMQDLAGIRIIGYVKSDIEKTTEIVKKLFEIDENRSMDKSAILGTDKVGYRSIHLIAKYPKERTKWIEYKQFEGLYFEIQIRTILQHAWAEIQHDRNYKFSGILPKEIQRRFSLLSGHLELADNEFDSISQAIEKYSTQVSEKTKMGDLKIPIDSTSLRQYLIDNFGDIHAIKPIFGPEDNASKELINELKDMDINTLEELDKIIPPKFKEALIKYEKDSNFAGLIRHILIIHDKDKYFKKAWKHHWSGFSKSNDNVYSFYEINTKDIHEKYGIQILEED